MIEPQTVLNSFEVTIDSVMGVLILTRWRAWHISCAQVLCQTMLTTKPVYLDLSGFTDIHDFDERPGLIDKASVIDIAAVNTILMPNHTG